MPKPGTDGPTVVTIIAPDERHALIEIEGTSPLLTNRLDEATQEQLTNPDPVKKKRKPVSYGNPEDRWRARLHVISAEEHRYGIPGAAIWKALIEAGGKWGGMPKTEWRGVFRIPFEPLEIIGPEPEMHPSMGRPQYNGPLMPIYRPIFRKWEVRVPVSYDERLISLESLLNLFERAGYSIGIGAWRPECNGPYGTFRVKREGA